MSESTSDRLARIEERLADATPGPWEESAYKTTSGETGYSVDQMDDDVIVEEVARMPRTPQGSEDACFVAHARDDLAALVAVVKAVRDLRVRVASAPFESLTRDSMERSLDAALHTLEEN